MRLIKNFHENVCMNDIVGRSISNKKDLIYLIRKFIVNNDGSVPKTKTLSVLHKSTLQYIWNKNGPKNLRSCA